MLKFKKNTHYFILSNQYFTKIFGTMERNYKLCVVWMFVCGFSSHSRIFHSYGDVTISGEGLQFLIYARHSWPLSSEGSLSCHTYCARGHPFSWSSPMAAFSNGVFTTCFTTLQQGFEYPTFHLRGELCAWTVIEREVKQITTNHNNCIMLWIWKLDFNCLVTDYMFNVYKW